MTSCFAQSGFAQRNFIQGCATGPSSAIDQTRIPRWLLKFERTGRTTYLSDVGGDVEGQFYVGGSVDVSHSAWQIDLERVAAPSQSATVHISPSALKEFFLDLDDLGQAKVTVSSWDGHTARPIIRADLELPTWGYDGEVTTFKLTEQFAHNPDLPSITIDLDAWTRAELASGARFKEYPVVWGNARFVPMFPVLAGPPTRAMIAGHNVATLPSGPGTAARYRDRRNRTYIGFEYTDAPDSPYWTFSKAYGISTAADLVTKLIDWADYPTDELDEIGLGRLRQYLQQFPAGGYTNSATPIFSLIANRFQRQFLFLLWQQAGKLTGCGIDPTSEPETTLVYRNHLLELEDPVAEETKYTAFKVRFDYRPGGSDGAGWYGVNELDEHNNPYLKALSRLWGHRQWGDPIDVPLHANSIDLGDVVQSATAHNINMRYAQTFHRGQKASYLQLAKFADMRFGTKVALVDAERDYDPKPAILIGRRWLTPELIVQTYRTIEPFELPHAAKRTATAVQSIGDFPADCFNVSGGATITPGAGPAGETAIVSTAGGGATLTCACAIDVTEDGWFQFGAKQEVCNGTDTGASVGVNVYLRIYNDAECSTYSDVECPGARSGGTPRAAHHMESYCKQAVSAGKRVGLVIEMLTSQPGSSVTMYDTWLTFSPTEPSIPSNVDTVTGLCT